MTVQFQKKFNHLPEALQQEVMQFIDYLLFKSKEEKPTRKKAAPKGEQKLTFPWAGGLSELKGTNGKEPLEFIPHGRKLLPVTPATEKPDIKALAGIWKNKDITLEKLRQEAWGDRQ